MSQPYGTDSPSAESYDVKHSEEDHAETSPAAETRLAKATLERPSTHLKRTASCPIDSRAAIQPESCLHTVPVDLSRTVSTPATSSGDKQQNAGARTMLLRRLSQGLAVMSGKALEYMLSGQGLAPFERSSEPHCENFGVDLPPFAPAPCDKLYCGICFEEGKSLTRLCEADEVGEKCGGFCTDCVKKFAEQNVRDAFHFCPWLRCPTCRRRVPTRLWSELVDPTVFEKYIRNARSLVSVRCADCDETHSLLPEAAASLDDTTVFASLDEANLVALRCAWAKFSRASEPADGVVEALHEHLGTEPLKKMMRQRHSQGEALALVQDVERRLTLLLGWLRKYPQIRTACCNSKICFNCKVTGWHSQVSCEKKQQQLYMRSAKSVQACPKCGIVTEKSEGCNDIACVCGESWTWNDEDCGDADSATSRPLLCLASFCPGASSIVRLLIEHAAKVNDADEEGRTPLMYAARALEGDSIRELIAHRADLHMTEQADDRVLSPLSLALDRFRSNNSEIRKRLGPTLLELAEAGAQLLPEHGVFKCLEAFSSPGQWSTVKTAVLMLWDNTKIGKTAEGGAICVPLWAHVQFDSLEGITSKLQADDDGSDDLDVNVDTLAALGRRLIFDMSSLALCEEIASKLRAHSKKKAAEWTEMKNDAATKVLVQELSSAYEQERNAEMTVVKAALQQGANPCSRPPSDPDYGWTALHFVLENTHSSEELLECLVKARADVNDFSADRQFIICAQKSNIVMAQALLRYGARFDDFFSQEGDAPSYNLPQEWNFAFEAALKGEELRANAPLWALVRIGDVQTLQSRLTAKQQEKEDASNLGGPGVLTCQEGHPLRRRRKGGHVCDLCDRTGTAFQCSQGCDYDVCQKCWSFCQEDSQAATVKEDQSLAIQSPTTASTEDKAVEEAAITKDAPIEVKESVARLAEEKEEKPATATDNQSREVEEVTATFAEEGLSVEAQTAAIAPENTAGDEGAVGVEDEGSNCNENVESSCNSNETEDRSTNPVLMVCALLRMDNSACRDPMENILRAHFGPERFSTLMELATTHVMRTEFAQARTASPPRPLNESLIARMLDEGAFVGAPRLMQKFEELEPFDDDLSDNTAPMLLADCLEVRPLEVIERLLKIMVQKSPSEICAVDDDLDNVLDHLLLLLKNPKSYSLVPGALGLFREHGGTLSPRCCQVLKTLSVAAVSREVVAAIAPLVAIFEEVDSKRAELEGTVASDVPLWLLVRFGLAPALNRRLNSAATFSEDDFVSAATALLQLELSVPVSAPDCTAQDAEGARELDVALRRKVGSDLWQQYRQAAWTNALTYEIREAAIQQRSPDEALVRKLLSQGADAEAAIRVDADDLEDWECDSGFYSEEEDEDSSEGGESEENMSNDDDSNVSDDGDSKQEEDDSSANIDGDDYTVAQPSQSPSDNIE